MVSAVRRCSRCSRLARQQARKTALPELTVTAPIKKPKPRPVAPRPVAPRAAVVPPLSPAEQLTAKSNGFDQARSNLYTTIGTTSNTISHEAIEALPQGTNAPVEKVLLQAPGVSQDSAASGSIHVRNDHANVQFRINGVMLPDGVTGFGSVLDTALDRQPVARHRRAAGRIRDAHDRPGRHHDACRHLQQFRQRQPLWRQPGNDHAELRIWRHVRRQLSGGGAGYEAAAQSANCFAGVQYFFTGSYMQTTEGIENPQPTLNAHPRFLAAGKRLCLYVDLRRPLYALEPDRRNRDQHFPDSQFAQRASLSGDRCPGPRSQHFQFSAAQREPIRGHPVRRAWRCSDR